MLLYGAGNGRLSIARDGITLSKPHGAEPRCFRYVDYLTDDEEESRVAGAQRIYSGWEARRLDRA